MPQTETPDVSAHAPGTLTDLVRIEGGSFRMGSDDHYPEERPAHRVTVDPFWIERTPVTNEMFRRFVAETGYVTFAERPPDPALYPGAKKELLHPGSLVFARPSGPVDLRDFHNWWKYVLGADWRHPRGPNSIIKGREQHPVVHVAYEDAVAYAAWAGRDLPTEAEWEFAARGGLEDVEYAWGNELTPDGKHMANTWQGEFPWQNLKTDGFDGTSPVESFPPNGYGLYDMTGNVWKWTSTLYVSDAGGMAMTEMPTNGGVSGRVLRTIKGGSFLCAPNYCRRYRPAARQPQESGFSAAHLGFRTVSRH